METELKDFLNYALCREGKCIEIFIQWMKIISNLLHEIVIIFAPSSACTLMCANTLCAISYTEYGFEINLQKWLNSRQKSQV